MKKVVNENQKSTLRKVLRYIRRYWGYLGASIILAAVTVALKLEKEGYDWLINDYKE